MALLERGVEQSRKTLLKKFLVLTKVVHIFVEYQFGGDEDIFNSIDGFERSACCPNHRQ
jgi:hypothetical protein